MIWFWVSLFIIALICICSSECFLECCWPKFYDLNFFYLKKKKKPLKKKLYKKLGVIAQNLWCKWECTRWSQNVRYASIFDIAFLYSNILVIFFIKPVVTNGYVLNWVKPTSSCIMHGSVSFWWLVFLMDFFLQYIFSSSIQHVRLCLGERWSLFQWSMKWWCMGDEFVHYLSELNYTSAWQFHFKIAV